MQYGFLIDIPVTVVGNERNTHKALLLFLCFLCHILINIQYLRIAFFADTGILLSQLSASFLKEQVIEMNDIRFASPVGIQRLGAYAETRVAVQSGQNTPVSVSPAVDALLDVSHNQTAVLLCQTLFQQQMEILPLHARGVLKFVDHHHVDGRTDFLIDKRGITFADQSVKQSVRVRKEKTVVRFVHAAHFLIDMYQQRQVIQIA